MLFTKLFSLTISAILLCSCAQTSELIPGGADPTALNENVQATPTPIILTPTPEPKSSKIKIDITEQDQLLAQSVIKIEVESNNSSIKTTRTGSGVLIDGAKGLILTSYSLVNPYQADGSLSNDVIYISTDLVGTDNLIPDYQAILVDAEVQLDLAVLQIKQTHDGKDLEGDLELRAAIIGDPGLVQFNDRLRLFSYAHPTNSSSTNGHYLTVTGTKIKTIRKENIQSNIEKWVVNTELDYSATGGPVFNGGGELVGILIPEQYSLIAPVTQIRPLHVINKLIERTNQTSEIREGIIPLFAGSVQKEINFAKNAWICAPKFSDQASYTDNELHLSNYSNYFPDGTENIYFEYCLQNLEQNILVEERWYLGGILQDSLSASYVWNGEPFAIISDRIGVPSTAGLPEGNWKLEIWANRILHSANDLTIGELSEKPKSSNTQLGSTVSKNGTLIKDLSKNTKKLLLQSELSNTEMVKKFNWTVTHNDKIKYRSPILDWIETLNSDFWVGYAQKETLEEGNWSLKLFVDGLILTEGTIVIN